jgi:hypothetical protein
MGTCSKASAGKDEAVMLGEDVWLNATMAV